MTIKRRRRKIDSRIVDALRSKEVWEKGETAPDDQFREYLREQKRQSEAVRHLIPEFLRLTASKSWFAAARRKEFHTPAFVRELISEAIAVRETTPSVSIERLEQAAYIGGLLPDGPEKALVLGLVQKELANVLVVTHKYPAAHAALDKAEEYYELAAAHEYHFALVKLVRSVVYRETGENLEIAERLLEEAAVVCERYGDTRKLVDARMIQGMLLYARFRYDEARRVFTSIIDECQSGGLTDALVRIYNNLGYCWRQLGDLDRAAQFLHSAMQLMVELNMRTELPRIAWGLARLECDRQHWFEALSLYRKAQVDFESQGATVGPSTIALEIVEVLIAIGDFDGALAEAAPLPARFHAAGMSGRAVEAAAYVREITAARKATPERIKFARQYLQELTMHPDLEFQPPPFEM